MDKIFLVFLKRKFDFIPISKNIFKYDDALDTFGIHGTPDPRLVGKAASHGCVRLTNWDAEELSKLVEKGVPVEFID